VASGPARARWSCPGTSRRSGSTASWSPRPAADPRRVVRARIGDTSDRPGRRRIGLASDRGGAHPHDGVARARATGVGGEQLRGQAGLRSATQAWDAVRYRPSPRCPRAVQAGQDAAPAEPKPHAEAGGAVIRRSDSATPCSAVRPAATPQDVVHHVGPCRSIAPRATTHGLLVSIGPAQSAAVGVEPRRRRRAGSARPCSGRRRSVARKGRRHRTEELDAGVGDHGGKSTRTFVDAGQCDRGRVQLE
jgi:hypothetical protein